MNNFDPSFRKNRLLTIRRLPNTLGLEVFGPQNPTQKTKPQPVFGRLGYWWTFLGNQQKRNKKSAETRAEEGVEGRIHPWHNVDTWDAAVYVGDEVHYPVYIGIILTNYKDPY